MNRELAGTREGHLAELFEAAGLREIEESDPLGQPRAPELRGVVAALHPRRRPCRLTTWPASTPKGRPSCANGAGAAADRAVRRHGNGLGSPRHRVAGADRRVDWRDGRLSELQSRRRGGLRLLPALRCPARPEDSVAAEERKLVTLLFADVSGSTRLAEELDAEVVRELMGAYFALAREEIEARGGTVEKFIGDAVMAVFGVPVAHEDDPARALRAALGIRKRLVELNRRLQAEAVRSSQVRIGINSGEVVSTTTPRRGEVMVTGDAVNVAARVQQLAEPGQILVGQRTVASAPSFRYRALGGRGIRGKSMDVEVSELVGEAIGAPEPRHESAACAAGRARRRSWRC